MCGVVIEERTWGPISCAGLDWKEGESRGKRSVSGFETEIQDCLIDRN